jgi:hypothetical protein
LVQILADWQARQDRLKAARYRVTGTITYPRGSAIDEDGKPYHPPKPARDITGKIEWKALLDLTGQRHRWEIDDETLLYRDDRLDRKVRVNVSDGVIAQNSTPAVANPDAAALPPSDNDRGSMTIARGDLSNIIFEGGSLPLFFGHGIVPTSEDRVYAGHLRRSYRDDQFFIQGTGLHENRECLILRTEAIRTSTTSFHEYWVDAARQSAVVRYTYTVDNQAREHYDIRYVLIGTSWLPSRWTDTTYWKGKTYTIRRLNVEEVDLTPALADTDFRLEVKPGMRVRNVTFGPPPNPLIMAPIKEDDFAEGGTALGLITRPIWPSYAGLGLLVLILALTGWMISRRWRRPRFGQAG